MSRVLGIGNALVDILTPIQDDAILVQLNLPKGSMQLVDDIIADCVMNATQHITRHLASGGSAANTIHALSCLGIQTGYVGKIGNDETGKFFQADMEKNGITPKLLISTSPSGRAIALISPDSERTFATFLGAAVELSADDLTQDLFEGYTYFHIEGYLVQNRALIRKALEMAKANNLIVSLDLASYNVVEANLDFLKEMVAKYVDILFANEEEAKAFTGQTDEAAMPILSELCETVVLKLGKRGSIIKHKNETVTVGIIPVNHIDTTGAGDLYAAGFIYGLINKLTIEKCGQIGALVSGNVIEVLGPKMDADRWENIRAEIEKIKK